MDKTSVAVGAVVLMLVLLGFLALAYNPEEQALGPGPGDQPYQPLNVNATVTIGPDNEVTVAVNPLDPLNLIAGSKDYFLGETSDCGKYRVWSGYFYSFDGGLTWSNGLMDGYPGGPASPLSDFECNSDPVTAFDWEGNAYYSGLAYGQNALGQTQSAIWVARSTDGGATYGTAYFVDRSEFSGVFHDKQWMAADPFRPGHLYVTWSEFDGYKVRIKFARSTDYGQTWPRADVVDLSDWFTFSGDNQGSAPVVGADGVVSVMWIDYDRNTMRFVQNDDGGDPEDWGPVRDIAQVDTFGSVPNGEYRTPTIPSMAADLNSSAEAARLYISWHDDRAGNGDAMLISSFDGGATWSEPFKVNDDNTTNYQFFPWVAVSPRGEVGVLFYDRRDDANDTLLNIYLAYSPDGENWSTPNLRVTNVSFDGKYGYHQSGRVFIGDYIGLAMTDSHAYGVWCDTRNERADLYAGIIELDELRPEGFA